MAAHWLVFMINKSTDRYMTPSRVVHDISTTFFNAVIFLDYDRKNASKP